MFEGMCHPMNMSFYCQEGIVDPGETWVNGRLEMYSKKAGKEKCKLEATVIGKMKGLSIYTDKNTE